MKPCRLIPPQQSWQPDTHRPDRTPLAISAKMWSTACGMMPRSTGGSSLPSMVCVLPQPVWPYAKMVPGGGMQQGVSCWGSDMQRAARRQARTFRSRGKAGRRQPACRRNHQDSMHLTVVAIQHSVNNGLGSGVIELLLLRVNIVHLQTKRRVLESNGCTIPRTDVPCLVKCKLPGCLAAASLMDLQGRAGIIQQLAATVHAAGALTLICLSAGCTSTMCFRPSMLSCLLMGLQRTTTCTQNKTAGPCQWACQLHSCHTFTHSVFLPAGVAMPAWPGLMERSNIGRHARV